MSTVTTKTIAKVAAVATGLAMAASLVGALPAQAASLTSAQVQSILSLLSSFGADSATIANVNSALTGVPSTSMTTTTSNSSACSWSGALTIGSSGAAVTCLQDALIAGGYSIPAGATGYFGAQTQAAVAAWQTAVGVTPAAGYFGAISQAHWNLGGGSSSTSTTTTTTTTNPGTGTGLKVSLSPTSPNNSVLVAGQGIGDIGDYWFGNPTSAPITVTGVTFNRIGVSNDQTVDNVYLYDGATRLTDSAGISNGQFSFSNAAGLFTVPAGGSYTVSVRADIDATNTSGQQIGSQLVSVSSTGTLDSSVSFPISSGFQTISAATLATVNFNATVLPSMGTISPQSGYPVWQNTVSISGNPVWLKSMTFTNLGSIDPSVVQNLRLEVDGTQVGSAVPALSSGTVTFDLSAAPVSLSTQSHIIEVLADITGGASRTIEFSIQNSSDAFFVDSQLGQPVRPTYNGASFAPVTAGTITIQSVSAGSGISVNKDPASAINDIAVGATSQKFATFDFLASGENVKVMDLYVCATVTGTNGGTGLNNGKIFLNGVQVGSTKDLSECATTTDYSMGSSMILPAGQNAVVDVYADAQNAAGTNLGTGATVAITLKAATSNAQGQSSLQSANVPAADTSGNTVNITSSSLSATKYSGYSNQTIIAGTTMARIGSFTLSAGSTEAINVNSIGISLSSATGVTNLTLEDDSTGTILAPANTSPSTGSNIFSVNFQIPASGTKTIDVYANLLSNALSTQATLSHANTLGTGATTGTQASFSADVPLQSITVGTGSLTGTVGSNNPVAANVIAGGSSLEVGDFQFSSSNSAYTISKLLVKIPANAASAVSNVTLQYQDVNGATQSVTQSLALSSGSQPYATATFTGLTFYVPVNSTADAQVWVSTPTVQNSQGISGVEVNALLDRVNGFQAIDSSGNSTTTAFAAADLNSQNGSYGFLVLRKSLPTVASQPISTTIPTAGQAIYKFTVSADPAGNVDIDQFAFNVATSSSATVTGFTLYNTSSGGKVLVGTANTKVNASGVVKFPLGTSPQSIGYGKTTSYELDVDPTATVTWTTASSITVSLAQDSSYVANAAAASLLSGNDWVWSDDSATSHTTLTSDWTNGYLLKDFLDGAVQLTYQS